MSKTRSQMVSAVLRNAQIPEDGSTPATDAQTDAAAFLNDGIADFCKRRVWREYIILGTYTLPANTKTIALSSITPSAGFTTAANGYGAAFLEVITIREGDNPLFPEDFSIINQIDPSMWGQTISPVKFINRGQQGLYLLGQYTANTTLSFVGKATYADLGASDTWIVNADEALIYFATGSLISVNERDNERALQWFQRYEAEVQKMIDAANLQGAQSCRIIPMLPFTNINPEIDTSITGVSNI